VVAIDGTKFFGSNKKSCSEYLRNKTHCFHSGAVMSTVGSGPKLVIGFDMYRPGQDSSFKDEGELNKITRARRDTENSIFNNLKNKCDLERCFVRGGKAVEAVLCLIFIASNIMDCECL
jgi:hypothetical protein